MADIAPFRACSTPWLVGCGVAAMVLALLLRRASARQGYGLEPPSTTA